MADVTEEDRPAKQAARFAWAGYQHVAAVLGAFSMAVFFGEVFDIGWRGFLAKLVGVWDEYVRPVVKWLADAVTWPLEWLFGWNIEVPLLVRDYFSVGFVLALSILRVLGNQHRILWFRMLLKPRRDLVLDMALWLPIIPFVWPGTLLFYLFAFPRNLSRDGPMRFTMLVILSPLFFLGLLLAVNYLIL